MRSRRAGSGAWRVTRSSQVRFTSSIMANSSPRGERPASASRAGGTRASALPRAVSPRALASRRAGSMVHTSTLPPCRARARGPGRRRRWSCPRPPRPRRPPRAARPGSRPGSSRRVPLGPAHRHRLGHRLHLREPPAGRGEQREARWWARRWRRGRARAGAGPPPPGARPARPLAPPARAAKAPRPARRAPGPPPAWCGSPAWRSRRAPRRPCPARPPPAASSSMASFTGISSGRVTSATAVRTGSVRRRAIHSASWRSGPAGTRVEERGRYPQELHRVAGGGGVHQHQVPARAALRPL